MSYPILFQTMILLFVTITCQLSSNPSTYWLAKPTILTSLAPGPLSRCRISFVGAIGASKHQAIVYSNDFVGGRATRPKWIWLGFTVIVVPKMAKVLAESTGTIEHILHCGNGRDIPIFQRLVESTGHLEKTHHVGNSRDIPIVQWLVENRGPIEHRCHYGNRRDIPTVQRLVESFGILEHTTHGIHLRDIPIVQRLVESTGLIEQISHVCNLMQKYIC